MAGGPLVLLAEWLRGLSFTAFSFWGALFCALPLPGAQGVVNSVSGLVYGTFAGTLVFTAVATAGAVASFLVGRSALRERMARATARWRPQIRALDMAVEKDAFKIIVLLRISPLVPFGLSSLLLSFTPVPLGVYAAATAAGVLPGALPFAYAGKLSGALVVDSGGTDVLHLLLSALGLAATVGVSWRLAGVARDALEATSARISSSTGLMVSAEEGGTERDTSSSLRRNSSSGQLRSTGAAGRAAAAAAAPPPPRLITAAPMQARMSVSRGASMPTVAAPSRAD
jgi:uncharacterized membrane protein YdjX (TVP38/TMEM64 family)